MNYDKKQIQSLENALEKEQKSNAHLKEEWRKYRLALNRIAHPQEYGIVPGFEREIARRALVIGMVVESLPPQAHNKEITDKSQIYPSNEKPKKENQ
jgi:hypothetical protein